MKHGTTLAACFVLGLAAPAAGAQGLNDPTRPPAGLAAAEESAPAEVSGPVLQSVIISPTRRAAIISGEMVPLGGKFGDATLVKVAENEVVLKSAGSTQVLRMYPAVEKREAKPPAPAPVRGGRESARRTR